MVRDDLESAVHATLLLECRSTTEVSKTHLKRPCIERIYYWSRSTLLRRSGQLHFKHRAVPLRCCDGKAEGRRWRRQAVDPACRRGVRPSCRINCDNSQARQRFGHGCTARWARTAAGLHVGHPLHSRGQAAFPARACAEHGLYGRDPPGNFE
jgi:hypothetical protein